MSHVLLVFLDGVGVGSSDPMTNPFLTATIPFWRSLVGDTWPTLAGPTIRQGPCATVLGADATLGVEGLPQSGTGTTTLLTGSNAAAFLERHAGPFPPAALRPLLEERNVLSKTVDAGQRAAFANAFPPFYFDRLARGKARRTTCTQAALAAGLPLRRIQELRQGEALSSWITNEHWSRMGANVPVISAYDAGRNLARIALQHDLTLFEYFHTDHVGHRPNIEHAHETLQRLDALLAGAVSLLDPTRDLLLVASDHGNFEDQTSSEHTLNPALVTVWGRAHAEIASSIHSIAHIAPAISSFLDL